MIQRQSVLACQNKQPRYKITATLLNKWQDIFDVTRYVQETENDVISYEDKLSLKMEEKKEEFIRTLLRIKPKDAVAMAKGRVFEDLVCKGFDEEFSPVVENGLFQVKARRLAEIDGLPIVFYGILDVLKARRIMDIKRVGRYDGGKYKTSHQHGMYLYLMPDAIDFTYLICDDKGNHVCEHYSRENTENIEVVAHQFISYLKANDLFKIYLQNWVMYDY